MQSRKRIMSTYTEETKLTWNTQRTHKSGIVKYYQNGVLHREDGPAITRPRRRNTIQFNMQATEEWYKNGKRHREDGPAIVWTCGRVYQEEYWTNGKRTGIRGDRFLGSHKNYPPKNLDLGPMAWRNKTC